MIKLHRETDLMLSSQPFPDTKRKSGDTSRRPAQRPAFSFLHSFLLSFLPYSLLSFHPSVLASFLPSAFVRSAFVRSIVPSFLRSFIRSFVPSFLPSFFRSFFRSFVCAPSLPPSFIPSMRWPRRYQAIRDEKVFMACPYKTIQKSNNIGTSAFKRSVEK